MKTRKSKELKTRNGMYLLKMDEMFSIRGGDNSDRPTDADPKDEIIK